MLMISDTSAVGSDTPHTIQRTAFKMKQKKFCKIYSLKSGRHTDVVMPYLNETFSFSKF